MGGVKDAPPKKDSRPTLAEGGIDKNLADRARKGAAMTEKQFKERCSKTTFFPSTHPNGMGGSTTARTAAGRP
jgi:hypothetical protein